MAGGYPCCCEGGQGSSLSQSGSSGSSGRDWVFGCPLCLDLQAPRLMQIEVSGVNNSAYGDCPGAAAVSNGTFILPYAYTLPHSCVWNVVLDIPNPNPPYACRPTQARVEIVTASLDADLTVALGFSGRDLIWTKRYPGMNSFLECVELDDEIPFSHFTHPGGMAVGFDESPVRVTAL